MHKQLELIILLNDLELTLKELTEDETKTEEKMGFKLSKKQQVENMRNEIVKQMDEDVLEAFQRVWKRYGKAVASVRGERSIRQARPVQGGVEKVAGAVAGEHAAGPVGPVRRRGQAHDEDSPPPVAEAGNGPRPVVPVGKGTALRAADLGAPRAQLRAAPAPRHRPLEGVQGLAALAHSTR